MGKQNHQNSRQQSQFQQMLNMTRTCDLFKFCTIPQANSFTQGDFDEDYCTNGLDAACVVEIIQENRKYFTEKIEKEDSDMMCPKPCHTINYSYSKMRNSLPSSKQETWYEQILAILIYLDNIISLFT